MTDPYVCHINGLPFTINKNPSHVSINLPYHDGSVMGWGHPGIPAMGRRCSRRRRWHRLPDVGRGQMGHWRKKLVIWHYLTWSWSSKTWRYNWYGTVPPPFLRTWPVRIWRCELQSPKATVMWICTSISTSVSVPKRGHPTMQPQNMIKSCSKTSTAASTSSSMRYCLTMEKKKKKTIGEHVPVFSLVK